MTPVEEYIRSCPPEHRERLSRLRALILSATPGLEERISYRMPTFRLKRNVIHFALHTRHVGLYPGAEAMAHFKERLKGFKTSKGAVQLPLSEPLPEELIRDVTRWSAGHQEGGRA